MATTHVSGSAGASCPDDAEILTAAEVGRLLRIGRSSVYLWSRSGALPSIVLRRSGARAVRRWLRKDVETFIEACREPRGDRAPAHARSAR